MKKLISLMLVLVMVAALSACGGKTSSTDSASTDKATTDTTATETQTDDQTTAAADSSAEVVKLKIWVHTTDEGAEGQTYGQRVDAFNAAHPNIQAELEYIPRGGSGSGYEDKINTALTTQQLPDVITLDGPNTAAYADAGIIGALDGYVSQESLDDYMPSILQQGSYNGKLYGLGNMESTVPLYYNEELLAKYNITPGTIENPWTWDDLYNAAKTITEGEKYIALNLCLDWGGEGKIYALAPFVWSNGGDVIGPDGLSADGIFNSAQNAEAMSFIKKLVDEGLTTATPEANSFELGMAAFMLNGPWAVSSLEKDYPNLKWNVMPYPVSPTTKKLQVPTGSWQFAMTASSEHPAEAAQLVEWMTNTDSVVAISNAIGMLPGRVSAIEQLQQYQSGARKVMVDQLQLGGHARPASVIYPVVSRSFEEAVNEIIYGEDVQTTLDSKVSIIDREAKRYK